MSSRRTSARGLIGTIVREFLRTRELAAAASDSRAIARPERTGASLIEAAEIEASGGQSRGPRLAGGIKNERHDKRPTCDDRHMVPEARRL